MVGNSLESSVAGISLVRSCYQAFPVPSTYLIAANLVLQSTVERIFIPPTPSNTIDADDQASTSPGLYADIPRGVFLVRGENVLLLGEIDLDKDDDPPPGYEKGEEKLVTALHKERKAKEVRRDKNRFAKLKELGFEGETSGEVLI